MSEPVSIVLRAGQKSITKLMEVGPVSTAVWIEPRRDRLLTVHGTVDTMQIDLSGTPRGAVLVVTADGDFERASGPILNDLAEHGYESLAADVMAIRGGDVALLGIVAQLLVYIGKRGWQSEQIGVIGYDRGGRLTLLASSHFGLGAAVSISPSGLSTAEERPSPDIRDLAPRIRTPWLGMCGAEDPALPLSTCVDMTRALDHTAPAFTQIVRYPGVGGDFYRKSSETLEIAASFDYWQRTVEWLNLRVVPRLTPLAEAWLHSQPA